MKQQVLAIVTPGAGVSLTQLQQHALSSCCVLSTFHGLAQSTLQNLCQERAGEMYKDIGSKVVTAT